MTTKICDVNLRVPSQFEEIASAIPRHQDECLSVSDVLIVINDRINDTQFGQNPTIRVTDFDVRTKEWSFVKWLFGSIRQEDINRAITGYNRFLEERRENPCFKSILIRIGDVSRKGREDT